MNEDLTRHFSQAEDSLQAARTLKSHGLYKGAVNHCYYAYFWIVRGFFLSKDIFTKTHSGVQSKFSEMFIATEIIPKKYGQYLVKLFKERQMRIMNCMEILRRMILMNTYQWWKSLWNL